MKQNIVVLYFVTFLLLVYNTCMDIFTFLTPKKITYFLDANFTVRQALEKFSFHKYSVVPVLNEKGEYVSSLSEGDLLRFIKDKDFNKKLAEASLINDVPRHRPYLSLSVDSGIQEILSLIVQQNFIPVVDDRNIFIGIIKRKDVINYILQTKRNSD